MIKYTSKHASVPYSFAIEHKETWFGSPSPSAIAAFRIINRAATSLVAIRAN